ncbi:hypothetical protein F5876DRAFT_44473 [Lentinula aff. lateritia]|uniref:Uncharacterized protein n=1 Tax=Lentinula aff. lateritia TaxID=2804960 RepID=A0ACC1TWL6_9AGAR|nr:hypothetical protein F5876DRAFT_44473 [Lentinula aff. lateritia]
MSFQSLISGSECAAPANPLSQVLKHTEADRSIQQLHQLPGTSSAAATGHDLALARQFFEANRATPAIFASAIPELSNPQMKDAWIAEQQQHMRIFESTKSHSQWTAEFDGRAISRQISLPQQPQTMTSDPAPQMASYMPQVAMYGNYVPHNHLFAMGGPPLMQNYTPPIVDFVEGKGKSREADFDAAFAQAAAFLPSQEAGTSGIVEVNDGVTDIEEALKSTTLQDHTIEPDFRRVWDHLQNSDAPPPAEDLAKWETEFQQLMDAQRDELNYGNAMQEAWENGLGNFTDSTTLGDPPLKFDNDGLPILQAYVFETNNKYLDPSNSTSSPLSDAKALLEQNGSLSEASLLLEAAIQKGDLGDGGYEAWILLGETKNMDEHEEAGMRALTEGVKRAEAAGASGAGMMSLAISFTNESMDRASHVMLLRWLRARFPGLSVSEDTVKSMSTHSSWDTHTKITDLYLNLARQQHSQGIVDSDVQIGLGVLYYTNGEYTLARDCFESALSQRPGDYLLWNRLGSSLSNGNKPEEALGAYREALQLRPTYTRAIYNVGVACLNIGAHKEAAEHFLSALALQEQTSGDTSEQLWLTLRRALVTMDRADLAEHAKREIKGNLDFFRGEGFDF